MSRCGCSLQFSIQSKGSTFHPLKRSLVKHCPLTPGLRQSLSQTVCSLPRLCLFLLSLRVLQALSFGFSSCFPFLQVFNLYLVCNHLIPFPQSKMISCFIVTCTEYLHNGKGLYICERQGVMVNTDTFYSIPLFNPCHPHRGSFKCFLSPTCFIHQQFLIIVFQ